MKLVDFTSCELSKRNLEYAGRAGEKRGIVYQGENWFLKFPKSTRDMRNTGGLSYVTSPLSEYLGSHIYQLLGYRAHDTLLGVYDNGVRKKSSALVRTSSPMTKTRFSSPTPRLETTRTKKCWNERRNRLPPPRTLTKSSISWPTIRCFLRFPMPKKDFGMS